MDTIYVIRYENPATHEYRRVQCTSLRDAQEWWNKLSRKGYTLLCKYPSY